MNQALAMAYRLLTKHGQQLGEEDWVRARLRALGRCRRFSKIHIPLQELPYLLRCLRRSQSL